MKNRQKGFIIPLVIAVVVLLGIGGGTYFYTKNSSSKDLANGNAIQNSSTSTPAPTSTSTLQSNTDNNFLQCKDIFPNDKGVYSNCFIKANGKTFYLSKSKGAKGLMNDEIRVTKEDKFDPTIDSLVVGTLVMGDGGLLKKSIDGKYLQWSNGLVGMGGGNMLMGQYSINTETLVAYKIYHYEGSHIYISKFENGKIINETYVGFNFKKDGNPLKLTEKISFGKGVYTFDSLVIGNKKIKLPHEIKYSILEIPDGIGVDEYAGPVYIKKVVLNNNEVSFDLAGDTSLIESKKYIYNLESQELLDGGRNKVGLSSNTGNVSVQSNKITSEAKNCSSNLSCFADSINSCNPAKLNRSTIAKVLGSAVETNVDFELAYVNNHCELKVKLNRYNISASEELLKDYGNASNKGGIDMNKIYADAQVKGTNALGKMGLCNIDKNKSDIIDFFNKKEVDSMYGDGWFLVSGSDFSCSGELFTLLKM